MATKLTMLKVTERGTSHKMARCEFFLASIGTQWKEKNRRDSHFFRLPFFLNPYQELSAILLATSAETGLIQVAQL